MAKLPIIAWDQAYNRNGDRTLQRAVVNAIRTYMDNHTLTGWVKAETLVHDTGIQERTVREQIAANVAAGWLEIVESGRAGRANTYRLTYPHPALQRMVEEGPCATAHVDPALQRIPTTPRTSPQEKFDIGTTPEEDPALQRMVSDPRGSRVDLPATETTTEYDHAPQRRVGKGAPERTVCRVNPFCDKPQPCDCKQSTTAAPPWPPDDPWTN